MRAALPDFVIRSVHAERLWTGCLLLAVVAASRNEILAFHGLLSFVRLCAPFPRVVHRGSLSRSVATTSLRERSGFDRADLMNRIDGSWGARVAGVIPASGIGGDRCGHVLKLLERRSDLHLSFGIGSLTYALPFGEDHAMLPPAKSDNAMALRDCELCVACSIQIELEPM